MNKQILRLAIPNIISNITVPLLGMADLAILGHLESEIYIGAIALGGMIFNFVYWGFGFLRMGTSGLTAQAFGAKNQEQSSLILSRALLVGFLAGLIIIILQKPIGLLSFLLVKGSPEVEQLAASYYYIRIYAAPATIGLYAITGWFLGMQNAFYPMIIAILVNALNIGLNFFFVFGLDMKSDGVALGTVIAQYTGLLTGLILLIWKYKNYIRKWNLKEVLKWNEMKIFFLVNRDIFIRTILLLMVFAWFTAESARIGNTVLAINTLLLQYLFIFSYFIDGYAHAAEALTGKFFGARDRINLKKAVQLLFIWGISVSIPFTIAYLFAGNKLIYILTNNELLIGQSVDYLVWVGLIPLLSFAAFIWDGVYTGATSTAAMRNVMIFSSLLVFLPVYFVFKDSLGNHALWLGMLMFMLARSVLMTVFYPKAVLAKI